MNVHAQAEPIHERGLLAPEGANLVTLIGAPRSGTTWIAKIFDSHPDVLYRHEPDTVLRALALPVLCPRDEIDSHVEQARHYLTALMDIRTLKSAGSRPSFPKSYHAPASRALRGGLVYGLRAADALTGGGWTRRIAIPDLLRLQARPTLVFKTVSARGRAGVFARAMPRSRIVFIVRHPCGQVASTLKGIRTAKFERRVPFEEVLQTSEARELGLTREAFAVLSLVEQAAWHWAILNQKTANDLAGNDRVHILRYDELCLDPLSQGRAMLAISGLSWHPQTENFLQKSTTASDTDEYFRIVRDSVAAVGKWRQELSEDEQSAIMRVATSVPIGQVYRVGPA